MSTPLREAVRLYQDWRASAPHDPPLQVRLVIRGSENLFFNGLSLNEQAAASGNDAAIVALAHEDGSSPYVVVAENDVVLVEMHAGTVEQPRFGFADKG